MKYSFIATVLAVVLGGAIFAQTPQFREEVALVEVQVPAAADFIITANIPIPPNIFVPGLSRPPLRFVDYDGKILIPIQTDVVSFYADRSEGADVLQITGRVKRDPALSVGDRDSYKVVYAPIGGVANPGTVDVGDLVNATKPDTSVGDLLAAPGSIRIAAYDPCGELYTFYPLKASGKNLFLHQYGGFTTTLRSFGTLLPEPPDTACSADPYPHMMGVHCYLTTRNDSNSLQVDLRISNGAVGNDPSNVAEDPIGAMFFQSLDVQIKDPGSTSWRALQKYEDPTSLINGVTPGTVGSFKSFTLVQPLPVSQGLHYMPNGGQFHRRLIFFPQGQNAQALPLLDNMGQGFARDGVNSTTGRVYWSWYNSLTARYFPQNTKLHKLDHTTNINYTGIPALRIALTSWMGNLNQSLFSNSAFSQEPNGQGSTGQLGWARPLGKAGGGAPDGREIVYYKGVRTLAAASLEGLQHLELQFRLREERMPTGYYSNTGLPTTVEDWVEGQVAQTSSEPCVGCPQLNLFGNGVKFWHLPKAFDYEAPTNPNANKFYVDPTTVNWYPGMSLTCAYRVALDSFTPHKSTHLVRYVGAPMALYWIANDPLARDAIQLQAELCRGHASHYPSGNDIYWKPYNEQSSEVSKRLFAEFHPNSGGHYSRSHGWMANTIAAAFAARNDKENRFLKHWCSEYFENLTNSELVGSDPSWVDPGTGAPYEFGMILADHNGQANGANCSSPIPRVRKLWWESILCYGLNALETTVFDDAKQRSNVRSMIVRSALGSVSPASWNDVPGSEGPLDVVPTTVFHQSPTGCGHIGGVYNGSTNGHSNIQTIAGLFTDAAVNSFPGPGNGSSDWNGGLSHSYYGCHVAIAFKHATHPVLLDRYVLSMAQPIFGFTPCSCTSTSGPALLAHIKDQVLENLDPTNPDGGSYNQRISAWFDFLSL